MSATTMSAIELVLRVSVLLAGGTLAARIVQRRSAALRHLVWSASLGGTVLLAVMVPWAPRISLPVKGWPNAATPFVVREPARPMSTSLPPAQVVHRDLVAWEDVPEAAPRSFTVDIPFWMVVWIAGASMVLAWATFGRIALGRLTRRAAAVTSEPWNSLVSGVAAGMAVSRRIDTRITGDVNAPMTWGTLRPVLLLPAEARYWTPELRRSVVTHEVAHVSRNDYLMQWLATIACAIYWFHPLAWMASRRMRQVAERACDDLVLQHGTAGEEYAAHLIGIARISQRLRLSGAVAIGMARPSTLEGRVVAVLDGSRERAMPTARARYSVVAAAAIVLLCAGVVNPVAASGAATVSELAPVTVKPVSERTTETPAPVTTPSSAAFSPSTRRMSAVSQGRDSTFERSFAASEGGELVIDLNTGGSVSVRAWDENRVSVRGRLAGASWADMEVDVEREANGVRITSRFGRRSNYQSSSNEFEIRVPRRYDVRISSSGGGLTIVGVNGRFSGHTGGGNLTLDRASGTARLTTGGGEIFVNDSDLSGSVSTGGGTVRLSNVRGGLRGSSGSGPVIYGESGEGSRRSSTTDISSVDVGRDGSTISIGKDTYRGGTLRIEKPGGDINLNEAPNGASVNTGGGDVRVGRASGHVDASTGGGDVTVGPASGSVNAGTGAGEIYIIVDRNHDENQEIVAQSGSGRVIIDLPADFDGRLELEAAYTRSHERSARITSDWDLEREPLTDWIERYGMERRILRASAVVGRGKARVKVVTMNGDIEIRRR